MLSYLLLLLIFARADFEIDGFTYHIIDTETNNVQIVKCSISSESILKIPSKVTYESIDYTVISIASGSLSNNFQVIYFPYTLIDIDPSSLSWLTQLQQIGFIDENNEFINDTLPPKMTQIKEKLFFHCEIMTTIDVNNVIELCPYCFQYCFHLTNLTLRKVEIIGEFSLFSTDLQFGLEFPKTLKEIHDHAFVSTSLTNVTGEVPNLKVINGAFNECDKLMYIPKLTGIVRLENFAFAGCYSLREIYCGSELESICVSCFNGCSKLESFITDSKNYTIAERAFCVCSSLNTFNFEGVSEILDNAFEACYSFIEVDLSKSYLEEILPIFQDCGNLTSIILPEKLVNFDLNSFEGTNVHSLTFSGTKEKLDLKAAFFECQFDINEIIFAPSCNVNLDSAFVSCFQLQRVVLPKVSYELHSTFVNCHNLIKVENLEFCTLLDYTFFACEQLNSFDSFPLVKKIGSQTFMNCKSLESLPSLSAVEIIESRCFSNCFNLKYFECGSELKSIGSEAFLGCNHLQSFSTSSNHYSIGADSFKNCFSLEKIDFSHCYDILNGAFENCKSLFELDLSKSEISSLSFKTFANCTSLHTVIFQPNFDYIDNFCFYNCINITSLNFPSLKYIYSNAFEGCIGLKSIVFENQPLIISHHAFHSCTSLESIELKNSELDSIATIENGAFENCISLKSFQFDKWAIGSIGEYAFYGCPLSRKLKFKGGSAPTNFTISDYAFSSSLIQSIDLRFDFSSLNLSDKSFVDCNEIKCVMIGKNHKDDVSVLFNKKIINGRHCPNYFKTHISVLVAIILSALVIIILITIIIVCIIKKKQPKDNLVSQPLITTQ